VAVQRIDQTGIDQVARLAQEEYRAKNRRFKRDLEEHLGQADLASFKECSMQYRVSLQNGGGQQAAETYGHRVVEVFTATLARAGEAVQGPRHLLRDALAQLSEKEEDAVQHVAAPKAKTKALKAAKAPKASTAALPRQLEEKIEALPLSKATRGGSKPSFLASLDAVLSIMSTQAFKLPVSQQVLNRSVKQIDANQAESLQLLHQHLVDAGGSSLDFGPMDRLLALRPLLLLKLQGAVDVSGALAADRLRSWWEWKEAAAAALLRLGDQERQCVHCYVSLCLKHLSDLDRPVHEAAEAGYPAPSRAPGAAAPRPALAPAWDRSRPPPPAGDFPALPNSQQSRPSRARA